MKIGIIGCGKIAERHLLAYKKMPEIEVVISDKDTERAKKLSKIMKIDFVKDVRKIINSDKFDAIDICLPTPYHKKYIIKSLEAEKHVFCEKPICLNLKEALEIKKWAEKVKKIVMAGYLYRFHPAFQFVKKVLEERIIGKPYFAIFRLGGRGSHMLWKHRKSEGGGAILEMVVHKLDLIVWYFENISKTRFLIKDTVIKSREIEGKKYEVDAEDLVMLELESNEIKILCESDLLTPSYMNYIEIHGENGSIFTSILHFMPTIVFCKEARGIFNTGNNIYHFPIENLFEKELGHFVECIKNGEKPLNSIEESIKVFEILEQAEIWGRN